MRKLILLVLALVLLGCSAVEENTGESVALQEEIITVKQSNIELTKQMEELERQVNESNNYVPGAPRAMIAQIETQFTVLEKIEGTQAHPYLLVVTKLEDEDHNGLLTMEVSEELFNTVELNKQLTFRVDLNFEIEGNEVTDDMNFQLVGLEILD